MLHTTSVTESLQHLKPTRHWHRVPLRPGVKCSNGSMQLLNAALCGLDRSLRTHLRIPDKPGIPLVDAQQ